MLVGLLDTCLTNIKKFSRQFLKRVKSLLDAAFGERLRGVILYGSEARGKAAPDSDIDLLVEMESGRSLLDLIGLIQDLEGLLGRKVDVVEEEGLHWFIRDRVLSEAIPL